MGVSDFDIGRVFSRAFRILRAGVVPVGVFGLVAQAAMIVLIVVVGLSGAAVLVASEGSAGPGDAVTAIAIAVGVFAVFFMVGVFQLVGSIHGLLHVDRGVRVTVRECLRGGLAMLLPAAGLTFLWFLGVWSATILFLVPGIMLACVWGVTLPVMIDERCAVLAAFRRSRTLTKGVRWRVFVVLLLFFLANAVLNVVLVGPFIALGFDPASDSQDIWESLGSLLQAGLFGFLLSGLLTSLYVETAQAKGAVRQGHLVEVFG